MNPHYTIIAIAMDRSRFVWRSIAQSQPPPAIRSITTSRPPWICHSCLRRNATPTTLLRQQKQHHRWQSTNAQQPADSPEFQSVVDNPPQLVRANRKHSKIGLLILATIPVTAFILGCWQVQRLGWKTELIAKFEDRLVRDPLPLPPQVDPDAIKDFDYRRVYARGKYRHDEEMLIGPRLHDGDDGYLVITPLDRSGEFKGFNGNTTILVCRGWIPKDKASQSARAEGLPKGEVVVQGLLREPWKKNMFTPENVPAEGKWYFPDVHQMAEHVGSQPVWIEETMRPDLLMSYDRIAKGVPIGRPPEVNLRNNHTQ